MRKLNFLSIVVFTFFVGCYAPSQYNSRGFQPSRSEYRMNSSKISGRAGNVKQQLVFKRLVNEIKFYLGTPYQYGGTSKYGIDCSGLVIKVYKDALGLKLPHSTASLSKLGIPLSVRRLQFGDLLFFQTTKNRRISHVGIYLYDTKFVHSSSSNGVEISDFAKVKYYRKNFVEARRLVNLWQ